MLYLNAEQLRRQVYLEATGRGVHCDCVVVAPCGEDRLALVAYELKSLRKLSGIVAELVSPRRSGHGSRQAAEELIESHDLVEKFVACLRVAYGLVERLNLHLDIVVAALVTSYSSGENFINEALERLNESGSEVSAVARRAAYSAAKELLNSVTRLLEAGIAKRLEAGGGAGVRVLVGHNMSTWHRLCSRLGVRGR